MRLIYIILSCFFLMVPSESRFTVENAYYISSNYVGVELRLKEGNSKIKMIYNGNCKKLKSSNRWLAIFPEHKVDYGQILNISTLTIETGSEAGEGVPKLESKKDVCKFKDKSILRLIIPKELLTDDTLRLAYYELEEEDFRFKLEKFAIYRVDMDSLNIEIPGPIRSQTSHPSDY